MDDSTVHRENLQNNDVKCVIRNLENWREITLMLHSVFIWEKPFYSGIIAGASFLLFFMLWLFDLSLLTTLSIFGMLVCILDYGVPLVSANIFNPDNWTGIKEKRYEEICVKIVSIKYTFCDWMSKLEKLKENRPKMYFCFAVVNFLLLAWIGNNVNNTFLTFIFVAFVLLLPGLTHHGLIEKYSAFFILKISNLIGHKLKKR